MILCVGEPWRADRSQWNECRCSLAACLRVRHHHVRQYVTTTHWRADQHRTFHLQCFEQCRQKHILVRLTQLNVFAFSPTCTAHKNTHNLQCSLSPISLQGGALKKWNIHVLCRSSSWAVLKTIRIDHHSEWWSSNLHHFFTHNSICQCQPSGNFKEKSMSEKLKG